MATLATPHPYYSDLPFVPDVDPVDGWELRSKQDLDSDDFYTQSYIARRVDGTGVDVELPVSRFCFTPTQARFAWLVRNGFPRCPIGGNWFDSDIDEAIERGDFVVRAVAA